MLAAAAIFLSACHPESASDTQGPASPPSPAAVRYPMTGYPATGEAYLGVDEDFEASPPRVDYRVLGEHSQVMLVLPEFYGNGRWSYYDTRGVAYEDVDGDGRKDIVVLARYVTGIGPGGAEPFAVGGFYLRTDDGFAPARRLEERVNGGDHAGDWETLDELVALGRARYQPR